MTQNIHSEASSSFTPSESREPLDLYRLLQVSSDIDAQDLKRRINQYYLEAQQNLDHRNAQKRLHFQQMYEIYLPQARHVLLDPERRAEYDRFLLAHHAGLQAGTHNIQNQVVRQETQAPQVLTQGQLEAERMMLWQQWQGDLAVALAESEQKLASAPATASSPQAERIVAPKKVMQPPTEVRRVEPKRSWSVETAASNSSPAVVQPPSVVVQNEKPRSLTVKVEHLAAVAGVIILLVGFLMLRSVSSGGSASKSETSQPFRGAAVAVPGIVQAEDYDMGGEGVSYSDVSTQNQGGGYREGAVGIGSIAPGQYYVGWTQRGEWIQYTVEASQSGKYRLDVRLMTRGPGRISVHLNGDNVANNFLVPDSGGLWQTMFISELEMPKGRQQVRLVLHDDSMNFDFLRLSSMP